ncbi:MAG: S8 family serine peptidase, partial [Acidimicrobiia bacterium]
MRSGRGSRALVTIVALTGVASFTLAIPGPAGASKSDSSTKNVPTSRGTFAAATTSNPTPADNRLLVTVDPGTSATQAQDIATQAGATIERRVGDTLILDPVGTPGTLRATAAIIDAIPQVRAVESNGRLHAFAAPNDPLYPEQYALSNTQPGGIRAESAWNDTPGTRDVVVGVLDSGILVSHPDLAANLWTNRTDINGCGYGTHGWDAFAHTCNPIDDDGHGTHVAGIIGATGNNGKGGSGVAQRASLMSLKMLDSTGDGSIASAIEAIDFGLAAKASGVNLRVFQASWGSDAALLGPDGRAALHAAIGRANAAGVLFVAASGNGDAGQSGLNLDQNGVDLLPCEDTNPNVVCVGATTSFGQLATFSNYGATAVDLAAPGDHILSTVPRGVCGQEDYCLFDGTSMAAPMVSGAAVDVLAAEPALNVTDLRTRLLASVDALPALSGKVASNGRLDVCKAIPNCDGRPSIAPTKPLAVRARVHSGTASLQWSAPDSNGNSFVVSGYEVEGPGGVTSVPFTTTSLSVSGLANDTNAVLRVRAVGTGGSGPWVSKTVRPYAGGYVLEGNGAATPVGVGGQTPSPISGGPSFPADYARGIAIAPEGTGGYIVDLYGGLHRFRIGAGSPLPARA